MHTSSSNPLEPADGLQAAANQRVGDRSAAPATLACLVGDVARGDQAAFHALYDRVAGQVYGLACRVLRDPAQAEQVAEQALVEVWRTAPCFDPTGGNPLAWILATTHRAAVDRARALRAAHQWGAVPSTEASQTAHRSMSGRRDELATVELAYVDGHTVHEIAQILNVPADQAAIMLHDGLRGFLRAQRTGGLS